MRAKARLSVVARHVAGAAVSSSTVAPEWRASGPSGPSGPSRRHLYSTAEWAQRCNLAIGYRIASHNAWDQVIYNHITLKVDGSEDAPDGPHFLINAFGLRFAEVTASNLLKVNIQGKVLDAGDGSGPLFNQGFVVHSAIHAARPDIHCIVHNHHQPTVAVGMSTHGVLPLSQEAMAIWGRISYHPFEGTATDLGERARMAKSLGPTNTVMILENHGPVCGGASIGEAFEAMLLVTRACEYQQMALSAVGGDLTKINLPDSAMIAEMVARNQRNPVKMTVTRPGQILFEAWRRQMEAKHGKETVYC